MSANTEPLDEEVVESFGARLIEILNSAGLALMLSIGHRTGLFDVMANRKPSTSEEIAEAASLDERYVREWLAAMVTGEIVQFDAVDGKYSLPREHAALLTRAATPDNAAATMQWISVLGSVEDEIVEAFRNGGGVNYQAFTRFHAVMAEESAQTVVAALKDHILPLMPDIAERLHGGLDVLDVGCGAGRALIDLARMFPKSRFTGFDFSEEAITEARRSAAANSLNNLGFEVRDVSDLGADNQYDVITAFDAIHDQRDPALVLSEIHRVLRDDGTFLMQEIASSSRLENNMDRPTSTFLYTISTMHCMTVSLAQGGAGLGTCWGEELALEMLKEAGFTKVNVESLEHDIFNSYFIARK